MDKALSLELTAYSKAKLTELKVQAGHINDPLLKFAYELYQRAEHENYMPEDTGDLKHNKTINVIGENHVRITQLVPYSNRRYYENFKNPNQKEWFDKYYDMNKQAMKGFLTRQITKELANVLGGG